MFPDNISPPLGADADAEHISLEGDLAPVQTRSVGESETTTSRESEKRSGRAHPTGLRPRPYGFALRCRSCTKACARTRVVKGDDAGAQMVESDAEDADIPHQASALRQRGPVR